MGVDSEYIFRRQLDWIQAFERGNGEVGKFDPDAVVSSPGFGYVGFQCEGFVCCDGE
jgi:hypothetical protein